LDAPKLQDDYYLNLLDWSSQNYIGVALDTEVFTWSASNNKVNKLCSVEGNDMVCSVHWSQRNHHLGVGNMRGEVRIYDVETSRVIIEMKGHQDRIGY
jgi:cell division cycle 20-like protein 1 (cofactor of APC complex)